MSSKLVCVVAFLSHLALFSQDYERIDATIELYPTRVDNPEEISKYISRDFTTDEAKVRAIYSWIIKNIAYHPAEYKRFNYNFKNYRERNQKEEKTRKKIIERTLQEGIAVCEGYAMVFEKLCELQGISNYLVRGDIKTHFDDIGRPFKNVHMWNVAFIDSKPYLFDPTWGAGKYRNTFVKEPSYAFYKAIPAFLAKTHIPQQLEDSFLPNPFTREGFTFMPIIIPENLTLNDLSLQKEGIISSKTASGTIPFRVKSLETTKVSYSYEVERKEVPVSKENGVIGFEIPIELGSENLLIYFNDQPALGYKVK